MNIKFIIEASEWKFEEVLPFDVEKISDTAKDFDFPLYDEDGNEKEWIQLPKCRVIELEGVEEAFHVVFEEEVIYDFEKKEKEDDLIEFRIQLVVDRSLWQQGEDLGIFYSWNNLPEKLKEFTIKTQD